MAKKKSSVKQEDVSNKTLATLLIATIAISLIGTYLVIQNTPSVLISGNAPSGTTSVAYNYLEVTSISVTNSIDFGEGVVATGSSSAILDSETGTATNGNWTFSAQSINIENDGTKNVSLTVKSLKAATGFIGGTSPSYMIKFANDESGSCVGSTFMTSYTELTNSFQDACNDFLYLSNSNTLKAYIKLVIPEDGTKGAATDTLTFLAA